MINIPTTKLPWSTGGIYYDNDQPVATSVWGPTPQGKQSGEWIVQRCLIGDGEYIVNAANAYPRLVAMLRLSLSPALDGMGHEARKLLRELGELE